MFIFYSFLYTLGFILMSPLFLLRPGKYLEGFSQRLGNLPEFRNEGRPVVWLHCVSVGEVNAARPLVEKIRAIHPYYRIVISTITKTGQDLARQAFEDSADYIFYFPFDWRFTVRRALQTIKPNIVLIMETELWFNFLREADRRRTTLVLVNGRLSPKSARGYGRIKRLSRRVLRCLDLALMQTEEDASRIRRLGMRSRKVKVTGNLKFDQDPKAGDGKLKAYFSERFRGSDDSVMILAASTHQPEEEWLLKAFELLQRDDVGRRSRLMIAPRHPERFDQVAGLIGKTGLPWTRRTSAFTLDDDSVKIILLDSIGELRSVYPCADIVFVGGSLIPHGGQNVLEPALEQKAIVTGSSMSNFAAISKEFAEAGAFTQIPNMSESELPAYLSKVFRELIADEDLRKSLGANAFEVVRDNRGAAGRTLKELRPFLKVHDLSSGPSLKAFHRV